MKVCSHCLENNVLNPTLKFVGHYNILIKKIGYEGVCVICEPILLEKHKEEIQPTSKYFYDKANQEIFTHCLSPECGKKLEGKQKKFCSHVCFSKYNRQHTTLVSPRSPVIGIKDGETTEWESISECAKHFEYPIGEISKLISKRHVTTRGRIKGWVFKIKPPNK